MECSVGVQYYGNSLYVSGNYVSFLPSLTFPQLSALSPICGSFDE